jgi:predicted O-linked N-acetylglucosamine transferase (SPINDLY family)
MSVYHPALFDAFSPGSVAQSAVSKVTGHLLAARRELAEQWMVMPPADIERHYAERLGQMHRMLAGSGLRDAPLSSADRAFIVELRAALAAENPRQVNPGRLLAAFLFLFPHELPHYYEMEAVPPWLRSEYLAYMLVGPLMYREAGEADAYFQYACRWLAYLHDNVLAKTNDEQWRNAGLFFTQKAVFLPVYFNNCNVRDLYRKRAAIMERTMLSLNNRLDHAFSARPNRKRLRVGILAAHYMPLTETYATLPFYQHLDRTKFEVLLFSLLRGNHPLEQFCARLADRFVYLPGDLRQRLQVIRDADLDFILIASNTTTYTNDTAVLALHRLARIQIASICSCVTTGMRNVDYYLSGRSMEPADAQSHYSEKLLMLDGPAHCFSFAEETMPAPTEILDRKALGIGENAIVFGSGANFYKILPEVEETWMRILVAAPWSYLMLYPFNVNWSNIYPVDAFAERLGAAITRHGLDGDRIVLLRPAPQRADVLARLRLADVYLDSFPYCGATSLLDPLEVGLPIVAMEGGPARARQAASLLHELEMDELVAQNADAYIDLAVRLGKDDEMRNRIRKQITDKMKGVPKFLDSKWYGEQVGRALERLREESMR